jgi:uncharacterized protein YkwD
MTNAGSAAMVVSRPTPTKRLALLVGVTVCLLLSAFVTLVFASAPARAATPQHRLMNLINTTRRHHGIHELRSGRRVTRLARHHSRRMAQASTLFHSSSLGRIGRAWGENVGYTYRSVRSIHRAFMRSRDHRWNILHRRFRRVGIGLDRARGRLWVTEIFSSRG